MKKRKHPLKRKVGQYCEWEACWGEKLFAYSFNCMVNTCLSAEMMSPGMVKKEMHEQGNETGSSISRTGEDLIRTVNGPLGVRRQGERKDWKK